MTGARASDPQTSHAAARSISPTAISRIHLAIMNVLSSTDLSLTDEQIISTIRQQNDMLAGYSDTNFRSRRSELQRMGFVAFDERQKGVTRSGRRALLWGLTQAGRNHLNGAS